MCKEERGAEGDMNEEIHFLGKYKRSQMRVNNNNQMQSDNHNEQECFRNDAEVETVR